LIERRQNLHQHFLEDPTGFCLWGLVFRWRFEDGKDCLGPTGGFCCGWWNGDRQKITVLARKSLPVNFQKGVI
jgi:hypothetical protein